MILENLQKYLKYAKEHIKSNSGIFLILFLAIPVLTAPVLMSMGNNYSGHLTYLTFYTISSVTSVGMFIVPIVIAIMLNGYLFSKRKVDFVIALPLSRKSLYWINYFIGMVMVIGIVITTAVVIALVAGIHPRLVLHAPLLMKFIIVFFGCYAFIYSLTTFCIMTTGHALTAVAMSFALMFLPVFVQYDLNSKYAYNESTTYSLFDSEISMYNLEKVTDKYRVITSSPAFFTLEVEMDLWWPQQLLNTFEIVMYAGLGCFVFARRKMEVAESSFITNRSHQLVKGIIFFLPLYLVVRTVETSLRDGYFTASYLIAFIIIYISFFIYDLIVARHRANVVKAFTSLLLLTAITTGYWLTMDYVVSPLVKRINFTAKVGADDVNSITIQLPSKVNSDSKTLEISSDEFISLFFDEELAKDMKNGVDGYLHEVTLKTTKGNFDFYISSKSPLIEAIHEYLLETGDIEEALNTMPFDKETLIDVKLFGIPIENEMRDEVISILENEEMSERQVKSYLQDMYLGCQDFEMRNNGLCTLRNNYISKMYYSELEFQSYENGERKWYYLSTGVSNETLVKLINLNNKNIISKYDEIINNGDIGAAWLTLFDGASHEFALGMNDRVGGQAIDNEMFEMISEWVINRKDVVMTKNDTDKLVSINYDYYEANGEYVAVTIVLPVDDEMLEIINLMMNNQVGEQYVPY